MSRLALLDIRLTICAAGYGVQPSGMHLPMVCGLPPGHDGKHRDIQWPVTWQDPDGEA